MPAWENDLLPPAAKRRFRARLLRWYRQNRRDLPWRRDRDPYRVWLSEIMLQQTRVAAVVDYYRRFLERFPTVEDLAGARLPSVLAAWSGLGYYRRARALHEAARKIVNERGGTFPSRAADLRSLPGIGEYTSAAIASISFNEPAAVVDGNVARVLQRIVGKQMDKNEVWRLSQNLLSPAHPGDFNQAMMELGATVCVPRDPKCLACPVMEFCISRGALPASAPEKRRKREISYALNVRDGRVQLRQRPESMSLMPGMWELPEIEVNGHEPLFTLRHSITVTDYVVRVVRDANAGNEGGRWLPISKAATLPITGLARKILRLAQII